MCDAGRRSHRTPVIVVLLAAVVCAPTVVTAGEARKPRLAVMEIEDATGKMEAKLLGELGEYLRARLSATGRFLLIDRGRQSDAMRELVAEEKQESHKECYDRSCQIPLGQALSADTLLHSRISRIGGTYTLSVELVDLAREVATGGAVAECAANPTRGRSDRLLGAVKEVVERLAPAKPAKAAPAAPPPAAPAVATAPAAKAPELKATVPSGPPPAVVRGPAGIELVEITLGASRLLMGRTEVTRAQWASVLAEKPGHDADNPVWSTSWYAATHFCNALSKLEGRSPCYELVDCRGKLRTSHATWKCRDVKDLPGCTGFRLPSAEEWRAAARAGRSDGPMAALDAEIWHNESALGEIQPVATRAANPLGLHDMLGNVREWVGRPEVPPGPPSRQRRARPTVRVMGGSAFSPLAECGFDASRRHKPSKRARDTGFRVVRAVD